VPQPPRILQIYREPIKPGCEAEYDAIEEGIAREAARLGCPHAYLGAQSLTGPTVAWWFNGYESDDDLQQVYAAYAANGRWMAALQESSDRKKPLTLDPIEVFAHYREHRGPGGPWSIGLGRFLIIAERRGDHRGAGTRFDSEDATSFWVTGAQSRLDADEAYATAGSEAHLLAVRPTWSFPAPDWVAADPEFWRS
jgi:hypothetical protein